MRALSSLRNGLVGAWCPSIGGWGGNVLRDLSGYGNHGTLTNMDPATDWVVSGGKQALDFDGVNGYVVIKPLAPAYGFSYSCWFKAINASKIRQSLFTNSSDNTPDTYLHLERISGTTNAMNFYDGSGYLGISTTFTQDTNWHHYAWTTDASGVVKYFRDGVFLGSPLNNWATVRNDNDTRGSIGGVIALLGSGFTAEGQMDDCRRYSRTLSDSEIRLLASERGVGLRPERKRRLIQGPTFNSARLRRQSLIGSGVY